MTMQLPYLFADFSGIGGVIKQRPTDFFVDEVPLYEPSGAGEHIYVGIEKTNLSTFNACRLIAGALNINPRDIGYAGLKDQNAITRQVISLQGTTEEAVSRLQIEGIGIRWIMRHGNKLRLGHLAGNRFAIKIRQVQATDIVRVRPILQRMGTSGIPNYFGEQRFGHRGDNHLFGAAVLAADNKAILRLLLGTPRPEVDPPEILRARQAFEANDFEKSMDLWPRRCGLERRVLARFMKSRRPAAAVHLIDRQLRSLWVSALQSQLFNEVVATRIDTLGQLMRGDIAQKENGACFTVEDPAIEQPRADVFEISPTGPLLGYRLSLPGGRPLEIEQSVFDRYGLAPEMFRSNKGLRAKGARRALRVMPADLEAIGGGDEHGPYIQVAFTLPPGSFATVLLRELMHVESGGCHEPKDEVESSPSYKEESDGEDNQDID